MEIWNNDAVDLAENYIVSDPASSVQIVRTKPELDKLIAVAEQELLDLDVKRVKVLQQIQRLKEGKNLQVRTPLAGHRIGSWRRSQMSRTPR